MADPARLPLQQHPLCPQQFRKGAPVKHFLGDNLGLTQQFQPLDQLPPFALLSKIPATDRLIRRADGSTFWARITVSAEKGRDTRKVS